MRQTFEAKPFGQVAPEKKKAATSSPRHRLDSQSLEIVRRASALPKAPRALDEYIQHSSG